MTEKSRGILLNLGHPHRHLLPLLQRNSAKPFAAHQSARILARKTAHWDSLLNAASAAYDAEWAADVAALQSEGIDVDGVNVAQLFAQIAGDPSAFGFTDITDPAWCGPGGLSTCASNNPNHFLYWDGEHPTTAADAQIANLAYADVTATPEPSGLSLSFIGLCAVLFASARMRRRSLHSEIRF